jgi:hypothetical protein
MHVSQQPVLAEHAAMQKAFHENFPAGFKKIGTKKPESYFQPVGKIHFPDPPAIFDNEGNEKKYKSAKKRNNENIKRHSSEFRMPNQNTIFPYSIVTGLGC